MAEHGQEEVAVDVLKYEVVIKEEPPEDPVGPYEDDEMLVASVVGAPVGAGALDPHMELPLDPETEPHMGPEMEPQMVVPEMDVGYVVPCPDPDLGIKAEIESEDEYEYEYEEEDADDESGEFFQYTLDPVQVPKLEPPDPDVKEELEYESEAFDREQYQYQHLYQSDESVVPVPQPVRSVRASTRAKSGEIIVRKKRPSADAAEYRRMKRQNERRKALRAVDAMIRAAEGEGAGGDTKRVRSQLCSQVMHEHRLRRRAAQTQRRAQRRNLESEEQRAERQKRDRERVRESRNQRRRLLEQDGGGDSSDEERSRFLAERLLQARRQRERRAMESDEERAERLRRDRERMRSARLQKRLVLEGHAVTPLGQQDQDARAALYERALADAEAERLAKAERMRERRAMETEEARAERLRKDRERMRAARLQVKLALEAHSQGQNSELSEQEVAVVRFQRLRMAEQQRRQRALETDGEREARLVKNRERMREIRRKLDACEETGMARLDQEQALASPSGRQVQQRLTKAQQYQWKKVMETPEDRELRLQTQRERTRVNRIRMGLEAAPPDDKTLNDDAVAIDLLDKQIDANEKCKCPICGEAVSSLYVRSHFASVHCIDRTMDPHDRVECVQCKKMVTLVYLVRHARTHPALKIWKCAEDDCGKEYQTFSLMKRHLRMVHAKRVKCELCGGSFTSQGKLEKHKAETHPGGGSGLRCDVCGVHFVKKSALEKHLMVHLEQACLLCGKLLETRASLRKHLLGHLSDRQTQCDRCKKSFCNRYTLTDHLLSNRCKPFTCNTCEATFRRAEELDAHAQGCVGQLIYECEECGDTHSVASSLYKHVEKKHPKLWKEMKKRPSPRVQGFRVPLGTGSSDPDPDPETPGGASWKLRERPVKWWLMANDSTSKPSEPDESDVEVDAHSSSGQEKNYQAEVSVSKEECCSEEELPQDHHERIIPDRESPIGRPVPSSSGRKLRERPVKWWLMANDSGTSKSSEPVESEEGVDVRGFSGHEKNHQEEVIVLKDECCSEEELPQDQPDTFIPDRESLTVSPVQFSSLCDEGSVRETKASQNCDRSL